MEKMVDYRLTYNDQRTVHLQDHRWRNGRLGQAHLGLPVLLFFLDGNHLGKNGPIGAGPLTQGVRFVWWDQPRRGVNCLRHVPPSKGTSTNNTNNSNNKAHLTEVWKRLGSPKSGNWWSRLWPVRVNSRPLTAQVWTLDAPVVKGPAGSCHPANKRTWTPQGPPPHLITSLTLRLSQRWRGLSWSPDAPASWLRESIRTLTSRMWSADISDSRGIIHRN